MHLLVDQGKNWDGIKLLSSRAISGENSLEKHAIHSNEICPGPPFAF